MDTFTEKDILAYGKRRWRRVQILAEEFWKRWRQGYLAILQDRRKWLRPKRSLEVGDVVMLRDKLVQRSHWPTALIQAINPSSDGLVRKVTVAVVKKRPNGQNYRSLFERPIHELVLLIPSG